MAANLSGLTFGRLTAIKRTGSVRVGASYRAMWLCRCACGTMTELPANHIVSGHTKSCGCLGRESIRRLNAALEASGARFKVHGKWHSSEYHIWAGMKARCFNPKRVEFPLYGGRGITVADRWVTGESGQHPFEFFLADVGARPSLKHSLHRLNNDGNYEPGNVRWATRREQLENRNPVASSYELARAKARIKELEEELARCRG